MYILLAIYKCQECIADNQALKNAYTIISESVFLFLIPEEEGRNICTLLVYASLYALNSLEFNADIPNRLIFYWNSRKTNVIFNITIGTI